MLKYLIPPKGRYRQYRGRFRVGDSPRVYEVTLPTTVKEVAEKLLKERHEDMQREVATGDNDFFFMTEKRATELNLPPKYFVSAVGRMRDIQIEPFTTADLMKLDAANRPTRLLALGAESRQCLAGAVQKYLEAGEAQGVPAKTLIATRNPWWRMERREPPAFFFAYLGRRNVRFIRNLTTAVPLTCLLCIYPFDSSPDHLKRLWEVLSDPRTLENLRLVGKSYGAGSLKVEPGALQKLPLPDEVVEAAGLSNLAQPQQTKLAM
jgi:adenine-specific DNA-methyltransferase